MAESVFAVPKGFKAAAYSSGIKKSGKLDLALICADKPVECAGVFTTNKVVAAPVRITESRMHQGLCQAILVNSGNANACTGNQGLRDARRCGDLVAEALDLAPELVAVSSTGVIGVPLPMHCFEEHVPSLCRMLSHDQFDGVAKAMMTTDAFPKMCCRTINIDGQEVRLLGLAKGAGMIHPDMATMLAFVVTDAVLADGLLDAALRQSVNASFNRITVDRDTSTNDMVLLLASGDAENQEISEGSAALGQFCAALNEIMLELAKMIVRDGEGSTKLVRIQINEAANDADALAAARSVATSQLVKTAFFGEDANWGRIIAAVGYSGADVDPDKVNISFDDVAMVSNGLGLDSAQEARASEVLKKPEFTVTVELGLGEGSAYYYTSDLTYDYIKINADYRT
ncbi:MAG: bifunctional glutamate N-acetyltransferase/amino-acid acetyltransferase ArgJ [Desulfuromonadales bacterium]|nr:bifunctional glutamate N-acetyltransferase/amino-acid acetyltransferase ArgJ [Desulfuromonadales bacterium]MDH3808989.1 bifunctional glutamate N-acetyltransferase/amino-acid acetyltransferase ArgJ [Desulfuromonadales bacterium]MDH3868782.1 bifunctional glutamate N-acetyltransferase/amino-acid acetyltransferase ArgJ [Desulfuromonadales bacterium]MDH4024866.1 bifunctional glutamate N-acetyltransferase/amino-acid acetyltransferase ArgJ [Desulfuromonadales bacterium]